MKSVLQAGWLLTVAVGNTLVLVVAQAAPMAQVWFGAFNRANALKPALGGASGCLCSGGTAFLPSPRLLHRVLAVCPSFLPARALLSP